MLTIFLNKNPEQFLWATRFDFDPESLLGNYLGKFLLGSRAAFYRDITSTFTSTLTSYERGLDIQPLPPCNNLWLPSIVFFCTLSRKINVYLAKIGCERKWLRYVGKLLGRGKNWSDWDHMQCMIPYCMYMLGFFYKYVFFAKNEEGKSGSQVKDEDAEA